MTDVFVQWLAGRLLTVSLEGAIVIGAIWMTCRFVPAIPPAVQSALWWVAALKLVVALLPLPAIAVPLLPVAGTGVVASPVSGPDIIAGRSSGPLTLLPAGRGDSSATTVALFSWPRIAIALWLSIVVVHAVRLALAAHRLRAVVARAVPCPADEAACADRLADALALPRRPEVRTSREIDSPQIAGIASPVVLLPARVFAPAERSMILCHELMHVRRRDLAWGLVPALAERLFFFHPLARLAAREYLVAREAACDAAVVRALSIAPADYGRMLLRMGLSSAEPALTAGSAPASLASLKRRLEMLHHVPTDNAARRAIWLPAVVACAFIPLQLGARSLHAGSESQGTPPRTAVRPVTEAPPPASSPRLVQQATDKQRIAPGTTDPRGEREGVVRILDEQEAANAQRQIERSLQELTEEYRRRLAETIARPAEQITRGQTAAALGSQLADLREDERFLKERVDEFRRRGLSPAHPDVRAARAAAAEAVRAVRELELAEQAARLTREIELAERVRGDESAAALRSQLERLSIQQEIIGRQLEQMAEQQRALAEAQRHLSEEAARMRRELEAR